MYLHLSTTNIAVCLKQNITEVDKCKQKRREWRKLSRVLPAWNGHVISALHRMGVTRETLAKEMGVHRTYLSKILNKRKTTAHTRSLVEEGLRKCAIGVGLDYEKDVLVNESDLEAGLTKKEE